MPQRVIHAALSDRPAVLIYADDSVRGYQHTGSTWREINPHEIIQGATILAARDYASRWPGLKLPGYSMAA